MPEEIILRHCSPTFAGLKTANMFSYRFKSRQEMTMTLRRLNRILRCKGIRVVPLVTKNLSTLLYFFRPQRLTQDLNNDTAKQYLYKIGYCTDNTQNCIVKLIQRLNASSDFPHEIGFFLGYPPLDVYCFIEGKRDYIPCKCCWRVYNNKDFAIKTYDEYKSCTRSLLKKYKSGLPLESLVSAV